MGLNVGLVHLSVKIALIFIGLKDEMAEGAGLTSNPLYPLSHCNHLLGPGFEGHLARLDLVANPPKSSLKNSITSNQPIALRHMHDGLQEPFHRPAVEALAVQRHSIHLAGGGLRVDRVRQLDFAACARRLAT